MSFRWSFSQWENYAGCPARWKYQSVLRLPRSPAGPAAARGLSMHDRCERYIEGTIDEQKLIYGDPNMRFEDRKEAKIAERFVPILDQYRLHPNGDKYTEHKLGFDSEWYLSGGISKTAAVIAVLDAVRCEGKILHIGEWKSGKPKDTHADQRKLYSLVGLRKWVQVEEVHVTTHYLEGTADSQRLVVKRSAEEKLKDLWNARARQMQTDEMCAPRPGMHCRWCDYSKDRNGPCRVG